MGEIRVPINRLVVGVVAAACLLAAAALWVLRFQADVGESDWDAALGPFTRIGLFLGAVWIALPRTSRSVDVSLKVLTIVVAGFIGIVLRPRLFLPVTVIVGILLFVLMPRNKAGLQRQLARRYRKESLDESPPPKK